MWDFHSTERTRLNQVMQRTIQKSNFAKKNPLNLTRGRQNTNETCVDKGGLEHIGKEKGQTSKETSQIGVVDTQ